MRLSLFNLQGLRYRLLPQEAVLQPGDEFQPADGGWYRTNYAGVPVASVWPYRRERWLFRAARRAWAVLFPG